MEVKIQCECGSRFAFDVEPVNGRMPVRVNCPVCDADVTDLANETIRQKLAPAALPLPTVVRAPVAILPETPAPSRPPIRVAVPPPPTAAAPAAADPGVTFCPRHPKNPAVETCRVCGKPICGDCMAHYGYTCSTYCRSRAEETGVDLPVYKNQRAVVGARMARVGALVWRVSVLLGVIFVGAWVWYTFFGSQPHVIYSESLPHGDRARFYQFLASDQVLSMKANRMSLFDVARKQPLWSVPLNVGFSPPPPPDPNLPNIEEEVELYPPPRVVATPNDLWILFPDRLIQYDRRSGNSKQEIPLSPPYYGLAQNSEGMTMLSTDDAGRQTITRIAFADGTVRTEPIQPVSAAATPTNNPAKPPAKPPAKSPAITLPANNRLSRILATAKSVLPANARPEEPESVGDQFVTDGTDVVQMKVTLIEHKTIAHQAMKPQKKTLVDNNLTAGQSLDAAEQMVNETRREQTGGVEEEDVSRYQITLRRLPAGDASDWTGEAVGPPSFFALKTLNVLASGKTIQVFDKHNKKLWTANLTYRIPARYAAALDREADAPCVEAGYTLYVFDQGMLTSFDAATGDVHWRLTSVGISQVQPDGTGNLYVTSTTASPDTIQFSQQVDFSSKSGPVVLKVAGATGKVIWRTEGIGDRCFVSGKYVYLSKAAESPLTGPGEDPIFNFDLYRVSPSDGHAMWDYAQTRHPVQIEVQGNEILLHFRGELQVVKFLSL